MPTVFLSVSLLKGEVMLVEYSWLIGEYIPCHDVIFGSGHLPLIKILGENIKSFLWNLRDFGGYQYTELLRPSY